MINLRDYWGPLTDLQRQFHAAVNTHDRVVLRCGRQVGKTEYLARLVVCRLMQGQDIWWLAPTHQLNKIGFRRCLYLIRKLPPNLRKQFRIRRSSPFEIQYKGHLCTFLSTNAPDSLQGATLDLVVIDEAATERDLTTIVEQYVEPTLAIRKGKLILASTPKGKNDFADYCQKWPEVHAPTTANPLIDPKWIEARRQELEAEGRGYYFRQEYLAEIVDEIGAYWERLPRIEDLPVLNQYDYCGIDWGSSSPYAGVYLTVDHERIYVHEEIYRRNVRAEDQAKQLLQKRAKLYVCDPSVPEGVLTIWKEAGLIPKLGSRDRIGGWEVLRDLIAQDKLVISPRCQHLLHEMQTAVRDPKRTDDLIGDDHALDALRYAVLEALARLWYKGRAERFLQKLQEKLHPDAVMAAIMEDARQKYLRNAYRQRRRRGW